MNEKGERRKWTGRLGERAVEPRAGRLVLVHILVFLIGGAQNSCWNFVG